MIRGQRGVHITTISELKAKDAKTRELGEDLEHGLKVAKGAGRPVVAQFQSLEQRSFLQERCYSLDLGLCAHVRVRQSECREARECVGMCVEDGKDIAIIIIPDKNGQRPQEREMPEYAANRVRNVGDKDEGEFRKCGEPLKPAFPEGFAECAKGEERD